MAIPLKNTQDCTYECTHEHLAMDSVCSPKNNHPGIERRKMVFKVFYSHKNDLRRDVVWWHEHIHDRLREWLGTSSRGRIKTSRHLNPKHKCEWDQVLSSLTVGAKCSRQLTFSPIESGDKL